MKAAVLHKPGDLRVEEVGTPRIGENEVLVKIKASGICGSDIARVMVTGAHKSPLIPGHEFSGEVAEAGKGVRSFSKGSRVTVIPLIPCMECRFCLQGEYAQCVNYDYMGSRRDGGFAEYAAVPADNLIELPEKVDFETGAFTEPVSVALHGIRRAGINPGCSVAVFGAGPIGLIIARWAKILGAEKVILVDIEKMKLEVAGGLGFEDRVNASETDPVAAVCEKTGGGADISIEAAGSPVSFAQCVEAAGTFGKVVFLGNVSGDVAFPKSLVSSILRKQLVIYGTWNSNFKPGPRDDWQLSLHFMDTGLMNVKPLITHRFSIDQANEAFGMMWNKKEFFNKVLFTF